MIKNLLLAVTVLVSIMFADAQTVLHTQNFSGGLGSWTSTGSSTTKWIRKTGSIATPTYGNFAFRSPSVGNGYGLALADGAGALSTELTSPAINCSSEQYVGLVFSQWILLQYLNTKGTVSVSTDMTNWTEFYNIQFDYKGSNPELIELDISSVAAFQSTVYVRFTYQNSLSELFWAIDDIQVLGLPEYDVSIASVNTPKYTGLLNQTISTTIQNRGGKILNDLTLGYYVNGNLVTESFNNLGILPFVRQDFTFSAKLPITAVDVYDLQVLSYGTTAGLDVNYVNDTGKVAITSLSHLPEKKVLLEEFTTAPCGWCPGGTTRIDQMMLTEEYVIPVAMHAGFGTDAMTIPEHETLSEAFGSGAPSAAIDRMLFSDQEEINVGLPSLASTYNTWKVKALEKKDYLQPVSIVASNTFAPGTRQLNVNVNATFHGEAKGDFRINCYIVEDSVTGTGSGYNQVSYYAASPADSTVNPWYKKGNPIVGFIHRNVVRNFMGGAWGSTGVIPSTTVDGVMYTKDYPAFTIPSGWNVAHLKLVVLVTAYNSNYLSGKNEVLNAVEMPLNGFASNEAPEAVYISSIDEVVSSKGISVFPNPASSSLTISYELEKESRISYEVSNIMGQVVSTISESFLPKGAVSTTLNTEKFESGVYFITVKENGVPVRSSKFIIER